MLYLHRTICCKAHAAQTPLPHIRGLRGRVTRMPCTNDGGERLCRLGLHRCGRNDPAADHQSDGSGGYAVHRRSAEVDLHHPAYARVRLRGGDPDERLIGHGPFGWFDVARLARADDTALRSAPRMIGAEEPGERPKHHGVEFGGSSMYSRTSPVVPLGGTRGSTAKGNTGSSSSHRPHRLDGTSGALR